MNEILHARVLELESRLAGQSSIEDLLKRQQHDNETLLAVTAKQSEEINALTRQNTTLRQQAQEQQLKETGRKYDPQVNENIDVITQVRQISGSLQSEINALREMQLASQEDLNTMIKGALSQANNERRSVSSELDSMKSSLNNLGLQYSAVEKIFQKQSQKQVMLEQHIESIEKSLSSEPFSLQSSATEPFHFSSPVKAKRTAKPTEHNLREHDSLGLEDSIESDVQRPIESRDSLRRRHRQEEILAGSDSVNSDVFGEQLARAVRLGVDLPPHLMPTHTVHVPPSGSSSFAITRRQTTVPSNSGSRSKAKTTSVGRKLSLRRQNHSTGTAKVPTTKSSLRRKKTHKKKPTPANLHSKTTVSRSRAMASVSPASSTRSGLSAIWK